MAEARVREEGGVENIDRQEAISAVELGCLAIVFLAP
jgi:hypothetical protein